MLDLIIAYSLAILKLGGYEDIDISYLKNSETIIYGFTLGSPDVILEIEDDWYESGKEEVYPGLVTNGS